MQLAIVAAGFTPGEADQLRRSMAAWRRKGGLEKFEQRLIDGMAQRGLSETFARQIYQQILGFGEYGFPESHSASFALLVYVSSWLKHYEPAAFCAALLNSQPMGFYAPAQLVADARRHGVEVRPRGRDDQRMGLHAGEALDAGPRHAPRRCAMRRRDSRKQACKRIVAERARASRSRTSPISRIAPSSTAATSTALAAAGALASLAGHRHDAVWDVAGRGEAAAHPCRRGQRRSTTPTRNCRRPPKARTSSPITARSGSPSAAIRSRCCAASLRSAARHRRRHRARAARPHRAHRRHRHRPAASGHRERRHLRDARGRNRHART